MSGSALSRRELIAGSTAVAATLVAGRMAEAQSQSAEEAAAQRAVEISQLEAARDFDGLYDLLHPDAQAFIPREVVVGWYSEFLSGLSVEPLTVTNVAIIPWTWAVTGVTYPETAEVSYVQPFIQNGVRTDQPEVVRLVDPGDGGGYRWFFGRSREFVDEQMARFAGQSAGGGGEYEVIELGVLPGFDVSTARVINANRVIAGDSSPFGEPGACGFVWQNGDMAALHELTGQPDWINYARDINEEGAIVGGSAPFEGNFTAYLVHGSSYTDLGSLPDRTSTMATGISSSGEIAGWSASHYTQYESGYFPRAVIWRGGEIEMLPDDGAISSYAYAINDDGMIAGTADWGAGQQAVIWTDDGLTQLPPFPDIQNYTSVNGLNARGTVIGFTNLNSAASGGVPWIWSPGVGGLTQRPNPAGVSGARLLAINDDGVIVGSGYTDGGEIGLLWRDGEVFVIDDLLGGGDWTMVSATGINNNGDICGQAQSLSNQRLQMAVLLVPPDV